MLKVEKRLPASVGAPAIRFEIESGGPVPLARFMELALYHPEFGYYERADLEIGRRGDFYTSVSVGPLFGELLGFQYCRWLGALNVNQPCQIVEAGAHDGQLAWDILQYLRKYQPAVFANLEYGIIEPSPIRNQRQQKLLREFGPRVRWYSEWRDIPQKSVSGIIFANELLDAMPVHQFRWNSHRQEWLEFGVGFEKDQFIWTPLPPEKSDATAFELLPELPPDLVEILPDQFHFEVSPAAVGWWRQAALSLREGYLATVDYGLETEQLLTPERAGGTLRAYHNHQLVANPLLNPGDQDLTAHVNFTHLIKAGEQNGLRRLALNSQAQFLHEAVKQAMAQPALFPAWDSARARHLQTLTHPEHLGRAFKVLTMINKGP